MDPRKIITAGTLVLCLLVSSPVWALEAQENRPVCPCWTAEELEAAVSDFCLEGTVLLCGLTRVLPISSQVVEVQCEERPDFFSARTTSFLGGTDVPQSCDFVRVVEGFPDQIGDPDLTPNEAARCRADILQVCSQLNPTSIGGCP